MKSEWQSGDPYDFYMGRWSSLVAQSFIHWLSPSAGLKWLDVGCGSCALSEAIVKNHQPSKITVIEKIARSWAVKGEV